MGLASQSARSGSRRAYMSSRRRRRRPIWLLTLGVLGVLLVGWWWFGGDEETPAPETVVTRETPESRGPEIRLDRAQPRETTTVASTPVDSAPVRSRPIGNATPAADLGDPAVDPSPVPGDASTDTPAPPRGIAGGTATESLQNAARMLTTDPEAARRQLTRAWLAGLDGGSRATATAHARRLAELTVLDSPDPASSPYLRPRRVAPNESMSLIIQRDDIPYGVSFLATINGLSNPDRIRAGDDLHIPVGSFEAVVDLSSRDLAMFQKIDGRTELLVVVPIEIGRVDDTPTGLFRVDPDARQRRHHRIGLEPRRQEDRDGPSWRGLELVARTGAGPGDGRSIRLDPEDARLVYELLGASGASNVEIRR